MQKYSDTIQDRNGNVITGASVLVKTSPGAATATIYSTATSTAASNPLTTDSDGYFEFWAADGLYTLTISKIGITTETTTAFLLRDSPVDVKGFGATGDGSTDDTAAFQAVATAGLVGYIPKGTYKITSAIALTVAGSGFVGDGPEQSIITSTSASGKMITLANGVAGFVLKGFSLTKSVTATSGGNGIHCNGTTDDTTIDNVWIEACWDGLNVGTCDIGYIRNCRFISNYNDGYAQTNSSVYGPSQWEITNCLSARNNRDGFRFLSTAGPAGMIVGAWDMINTFANAGRGIHIVGNATTPIYDVRLSNAFIGSDGLAGIRMDTYGESHFFSNVFIERAGMDATGVGLATAASNAANGILSSANDLDLSITGGGISACSLNGISWNSTNGQLAVVGSRITDCGQAGTGGSRNGIAMGAGKARIVGCRIGNDGAGTAQIYGVATSVDTLVVMGNDLTNNVTAATNGTLTSSIVRGNQGYVSKAVGTGSIASGATTAVITHGLSATPLAANIQWTFTENPTNPPGLSWVTTITATQFTVNVAADPGASNLDFSWEASTERN